MSLKEGSERANPVTEILERGALCKKGKKQFGGRRVALLRDSLFSTKGCIKIRIWKKLKIIGVSYPGKIHQIKEFFTKPE